MGRSLHCQVEHHVRPKFATLILHAIYNFKIYDYVIDTMYTYSWKKIVKILTHFGDALCKKYVYFFVCT